MTGDTALLWSGTAGHMLSVIELCIEVLFKLNGEGPARGIGAIHILMTDGTDRAAGGVVFSSMTINAVFVARKVRAAGIVGSVVTVGTADRSVLPAGMKEF